MTNIALITKEDFEELKNILQKTYNPLMTIEETAEYLRLSVHTIRHKIADKTFLPQIHYSAKTGKILFAKERLDNWLWETNKENPSEYIQEKQSGVDRFIHQWSQNQEINGSGMDTAKRQKGRK